MKFCGKHHPEEDYLLNITDAGKLDQDKCGCQIDEVEDADTILRSITISSTEQLSDKCAEYRDTVIASFDIYDNKHSVSVDLIKDIATIARTNIGISKPFIPDGLCSAEPHKSKNG